jgi:tripartite-type tricarboxylate transporter receptor subunit TctC
LALAFATCGTAFAQGWPDKPVRVVVPFAAGGSTDVIARAIMQRVSQNLGRQFIVDNRPGAGGTLGSAEVARAAADGYTLLFTSSTHVIAPQLMAKVPYHAVNDFTPIAHLADAPLFLLVPRTLNVNSTASFLSIGRLC